ncbi:MAG: fimbria major subunit [Bacteroidales bacterium]|jgi:hypothetical protein|nr:fimbria major subunit [Bacteroidales bacterium]
MKTELYHKRTALVATAFAVVLLTAACSKEETVNQDTNGTLMPETLTSVTFTVDQGTKATEDFNVPAGRLPSAESNEMRLVPSDLKLLIFDVQSGLLEKMESFTTTTSLTVLVKSGDKKIYAVGNVNTLFDIDPSTGATLPSTSFLSKYGALTVGTTTLSAFKALAFDAGTPQPYSVNKASTVRTYNLRPLWQFPNPATQGQPVASNDSIVYTLAPNITATGSQSGTASESGTSVNNHFSLKLKFMSAKARVAFYSTTPVSGTNQIWHTTEFGDAYINGSRTDKLPQWTIKNQPRYSYYIGAFAGQPTSYYYNFTGSGAADYEARFDQANNINRQAAVYSTSPTAFGSPDTTQYMFTPDNNSSKGNGIQRGQSTFAAVKLMWYPQIVLHSAVETPGVAGGFTITPVTNFGGPDGIYVPTFNSFVYLRKNIGTSQYLQAGNFYAGYAMFGGATIAQGLEELEKAWWINKHWTGTGTVPSAAAIHTQFVTEVINEPTLGNGNADNIYFGYTEGICYYRIDIGAMNNGAIQYGIKRGYKYDMLITGITGIGYPEERYLFENPDDPVEANSFLTVEVLVAPWTTASSSYAL